MGCFSSKSSNIQQKIRTQQSKPVLRSNMATIPQQQISLLVAQLSQIFIPYQMEQKDRNALILGKLEPDAKIKCAQVAKYFKKQLQANNNNQNAENVRQCVLAITQIVNHTQYYQCFSIYDKKQIDNLGLYLQKQTDIRALDSCLQLLQALFLKHGYVIYSTSQILFSAILSRFLDFSSDDLRMIAAQIITQMIADNKKLIKKANQPYYFIQFWLYTINKQEELERQLFFIERVKEIYASDKAAENYFFHNNDFKVFIDLLYRVITSCPDGKSMRIPLECYLTLTCCQIMRPKPLKIDDIKQYIASLQGQNLGLNDLFTQINML